MYVLENFEKDIDKLKKDQRDPDLAAWEDVLANELNEWMAKEELWGRQRARAEWLEEGDKNITFFLEPMQHNGEKKYW